MKKVFALAGAVLLTLFAAELLYFHLVLTSPAPDGEAEAVIVTWGSLGEMALYKIRGKLPERNPKASPVMRKLKSWLLFRV
jgi:hypothetical protein